MDRVTYKLHPTYQDYLFGSDGSVWSAKWGRLRQMLPFCHDKTGYLRINACDNGAIRTHLVHRLVLETFVGPCPDGMECRHLDGNRKNNSLDNLVWGTRLENMADRDRHGRTHRCCGSLQGRSKLKDNDVCAIRKLYRSGMSQGAIAKQYGVTQTNISQICTGKTWRHLLENAK